MVREGQGRFAEKIESMIRILCLFLLVGLGACAGSAYRLPEVSDADLLEAQASVDASRTPLRIHDRGDSAYRSLLAKVTNRLLAEAQPLCQHTGYNKCFFQPVYNSGSEINAFASDGYKVTVYRGLLQYLESEDEIAAVLAHEMGHHLARHNEEKTENAAIGAAAAGLLTAVLIGAANANNPYYDPLAQPESAQAVDDMMALGSEIGALSYSKEEEREADLLGAYLLARAGYDLDRAGRVLRVLVDLPGNADGARSGMFNTHPTGVERIVTWQKTVQEIRANPSKLPYNATED